MQHVCNDINGPAKWFYEANEKTYHRRFDNNDANEPMTSKIRGQSLPDPWKLWQDRCHVAGLNIHTEPSQKLKPQKATFDLWNHWQGVKDA